MGFSQYTCLPACMASKAMGVCHTSCVATTTASMSFRSSNLRWSSMMSAIFNSAFSCQQFAVVVKDVRAFQFRLYLRPIAAFVEQVAGGGDDHIVGAGIFVDAL